MNGEEIDKCNSLDEKLDNDDFKETIEEISSEGKTITESSVDEKGRLNADVYTEEGHVKSVKGLFGPVYEYDKDTLSVAVLGDLHGHISQALQCLTAWETKTKRSIDYVLQVGDFGLFTYQSVMDKATKSFFEKDPEEFGFKDFYEKTEKGDKFFGDDSEYLKDMKLYFIKGNHEDFQFLKNVQGSVDAYDRFFYVPNGESVVLRKNKRRFTIAALGGVEYGIPKEAAILDSEIKRLNALDFDVLLSHQPAKHDSEPNGSEKVTRLIEYKNPRFHFSGHQHRNYDMKLINNTESYCLNNFNFKD